MTAKRFGNRRAACDNGRMSPDISPINQTLDPDKLAEWARGAPDGRECQRARELCRKKYPTVKTMRELFASIGIGTSSVEEALAHRARHLADAWMTERAVSENKAARKQPPVAAHGSPLDSFSELAMAQMGPLSQPMRAIAEIDVGSLATSGTPEALMDRFVQRRRRSDWATVARREHGGAFFSDPMFLSMMRIVDPIKLPAALQDLLAVSILCACPQSAKAIMSFGALSDVGFDMEALGLSSPFAKVDIKPRPKITSLLGLALLGSGNSSLSQSRPHAFYNSDDAIILCSVSVALGCASSSDPAPMLGLRVPGAKKPLCDAMGLSLNFRMVRCARHFLALGMDPSAPSCGPRAPLSSTLGAHFEGTHPLRAEALMRIYAHGEALALGRHLGESVGIPVSARPSPRL